MAHFVLVHGAWHGAWCWRDVTEALIRAGHRAHAVTLTGVGERAHLLSPEITLQTHIQDVMQAIEHEEMHDVILAVHSYAGMIGTAVADRMTDRLSHLVYVDAVVPKPGEAWSGTHSRATQESRIQAAQASAWYAFPRPEPLSLVWMDHRRTGSIGVRHLTLPSLTPNRSISRSSGWRLFRARL